MGKRQKAPTKVALYHDVRAWDTFDEAAAALHARVAVACAEFPDRPRVLYLDVQGHRNEGGDFDHDLFELLSHFLIRALLPYLDEAHTPWCGYTNSLATRLGYVSPV